MMLRLRFFNVLLLMAVTATCGSGCGSEQDADQPAVGSISINAREEDALIKSPVKRARPR